MAKKAKHKEILVVASKLKDAVKDMGLQSAGDLVEAVSDTVHGMLSAAGKRTKLNNRQTMRAHDL